jgi:transposase
MADAMLTDSTRPVTGGVDTHKDTHVAAVVDRLGVEIATRAFPTTSSGYQDLARWLTSHGDLDRVGVEGCGSWGAGIARHLTAGGVTVVEINRPNRQARRSQGKSDPLDAIAAARSALAGLHAGIPKTGTGKVESIRTLRIVRRSAITWSPTPHRTLSRCHVSAPTPQPRC